MKFSLISLFILMTWTAVSVACYGWLVRSHPEVKSRDLRMSVYLLLLFVAVGMQGYTLYESEKERRSLRQQANSQPPPAASTITVQQTWRRVPKTWTPIQRQQSQEEIKEALKAQGHIIDETYNPPIAYRPTIVTDETSKVHE